MGMLDAFGGFLDGAELVETAIARELLEELRISPSSYDEPAYLTSGLGNYRYQDENIPVSTCLFWTRLKPHAKLTPSDDVADIVTIPLADINLEELHDDDIRAGIKKLRAMFL
jgi:ADP-ribose pyrophosphatase YjhB (NUDIX family)